MGVHSFLAVGLGAALGAWMRWGLGVLLNPLFSLLPIGTLLANLIGAYLMGIAMAVFVLHHGLPAEVRLFALTGFLGGLTTFSSFSGEAVTLLSRGTYGWAAMHVLSHVLGSLIMTGLGLLTVHLLKN